MSFWVAIFVVVLATALALAIWRAFAEANLARELATRVQELHRELVRERFSAPALGHLRLELQRERAARWRAEGRARGEVPSDAGLDSLPGPFGRSGEE